MRTLIADNHGPENHYDYWHTWRAQSFLMDTALPSNLALFLCVKNLTMGFCRFQLEAGINAVFGDSHTNFWWRWQLQISCVQHQFSRSVLSDFLWPMDYSTLQASLFITNSQSLLKLMSMESVMSSNHLILCRPLLLLTSTFLSIRVFSNESVVCIRWPKY